mmetsp:Transcript_116013/g.328301  ORF Transcript_116013/g.328301 Transcript_116013/m.328301 type:complete len:269 (-) Transcript_116013:240-1046(-)
MRHRPRLRRPSALLRRRLLLGHPGGAALQAAGRTAGLSRSPQRLRILARALAGAPHPTIRQEGLHGAVVRRPQLRGLLLVRRFVVGGKCTPTLAGLPRNVGRLGCAELLHQRRAHSFEEAEKRCPGPRRLFSCSTARRLLLDAAAAAVASLWGECPCAFCGARRPQNALLGRANCYVVLFRASLRSRGHVVGQDPVGCRGMLGNGGNDVSCHAACGLGSGGARHHGMLNLQGSGFHRHVRDGRRRQRHRRARGVRSLALTGLLGIRLR